MKGSLKKSAYNIGFGILGQLVTLAIGLILPRLRIQSFGSEVNGLLSSITQIYAYLAILEAGVGSATIQALYRPVAQNEKEDINSVLSATHRYYKRTGMIYLCCVLVFAAAYPWVIDSSIDKWTIVAVILFNGLGNVLSYFFQGKYKLLLRAEGKQYIITNLATFVSLASGVAKIILISLGCSVVSLQAAYFLLHVLQVGYFAYYTRKHYKWIDLSVPPNNEAISQKSSVLVHQISQLVFNNTDMIILTMFCGLEAVSIYAVYNMVFDIVSTAIQHVNDGVSFKLGQLYNSKRDIFIRIYTVYERYYTALSFSFYCVLYICIEPFISLYTDGLDINYALKYLPLLFIGIKLLISGRAPSGFLATYAGHFKQTKFRAVLEMCINLGVSLACVQFMGIYGVLVGTLAALLYRANDMIIYANRKLLGRSPMATYQYWLINLALFGVISFVRSLIQVEITSYLELIAMGIISGIIVCSLFAGVTFLTSYKDTREMITYLRPKKKKQAK